jgi:hypothetical protein
VSSGLRQAGPVTLAFAPVLVLELGRVVLELEGQQVAPEVEFAARPGEVRTSNLLIEFLETEQPHRAHLVSSPQH